MTKQDLKQIGLLLDQKLDQKLDEKLSATKNELKTEFRNEFVAEIGKTESRLITQFCQVIEDNITPQFAAVHEEIDWIKTNMVTKSDLNIILSRMSSEYDWQFRSRDRSFNNLVKKLGTKKVFNKQEVGELQISKSK